MRGDDQRRFDERTRSRLHADRPAERYPSRRVQHRRGHARKGPGRVRVRPRRDRGDERRRRGGRLAGLRDRALAQRRKRARSRDAVRRIGRRRARPRTRRRHRDRVRPPGARAHRGSPRATVGIVARDWGRRGSGRNAPDDRDPWSARYDRRDRAVGNGRNVRPLRGRRRELALAAEPRRRDARGQLDGLRVPRGRRGVHHRAQGERARR